MCKTGKIEHKSLAGASILRRKLKNKGLNVYRCKSCGYWHLGNSRKNWNVQSRIDQLLGK